MVSYCGVIASEKKRFNFYIVEYVARTTINLPRSVECPEQRNIKKSDILKFYRHRQ